MLSGLLLQAIASGAITGCVYGLIALSIVIVFKSTDVVNFAGGELVMLGAYAGLFCLTVLQLNYALMLLVVVLVVCAVGMLFQRITLETIVGRRHSPQADLVPLVVATIGLSDMIKGAVRAVPYTQEVRRLPALIVGRPIFLGPVVLQRQDLAILGCTVLMMALLAWFFGVSETGKALRAISQNPRAAALSGIPVRRMRMAAWGLSAGIAGVAGVLLAPKLMMTPDMGSVVMMAFAAAIIGGFTSLPGAVVGGLIIGVLQNLVGIFVSTQAISVTPFFLIMALLLLRPQGLFGEALGLKKV